MVPTIANVAVSVFRMSIASLPRHRSCRSSGMPRDVSRQARSSYCAWTPSGIWVTRRGRGSRTTPLAQSRRTLAAGRTTFVTSVDPPHMKQGAPTRRNTAGNQRLAVEDATVVGLGTGSTAAYAIRAIGQAVDAGLDVVGVPTSFQSRQLARDCGIPLADLDDVSVDLAIDGADEVASGNLIKGGGAAHAREKIVDASADRFLVVADPTKEAAVLSYPVPVEVLPMARSTVVTAVEELGGDPTLRRAERKDGPVVTDNGYLVLDCDSIPSTTPPHSPATSPRCPVLSSTGCSSVRLTRFTSALLMASPSERFRNSCRWSACVKKIRCLKRPYRSLGWTVFRSFSSARRAAS